VRLRYEILDQEVPLARGQGEPYLRVRAVDGRRLRDPFKLFTRIERKPGQAALAKAPTATIPAAVARCGAHERRKRSRGGAQRQLYAAVEAALAATVVAASTSQGWRGGGRGGSSSLH